MKMQKKIIEPTESIKKKMASFHQIRDQVQNYLQGNNDLSSFSSKINTVLSHAELTYAVSGEAVPLSDVDRTSSMVCGPAFVSEEYPQPKDLKGEKMFPALQLDLEWVNCICDKNFQAGLLQLWWSPDEYDGFIRLIPLKDLNASAMVPIELDPTLIAKASDCVPFQWQSDDENAVFVIRQCSPIGITYPPFADEVDDFIDNFSGELDKSFVKNLNKLCYCDSFYSSRLPAAQHLFNLFGYFKHHAVAAYEVDNESCFLHLGNWGSGAIDANIFFEKSITTEVSEFTFSFGR
jgi:hypothetical protein